MVKNLINIRYYLYEAQKSKPKYKKSKYKYGYTLRGRLEDEVKSKDDIKTMDIFFNQFVANKDTIDMKNLKGLTWIHVYKISENVIYFRHVVHLQKSHSVKEYELDRESFYELITEPADDFKIDLRTKKYLICPGHCKGKFINFQKLVSLYKVKRAHCVNLEVVPDNYPKEKLNKLIKLEPRLDNNYQLKIEVFKHKQQRGKKNGTV